MKKKKEKGKKALTREKEDHVVQQEFFFFESVPNEILYLIIDYLDGRALLRLSMVNRQFAQLCQEEKLWMTRVNRENVLTIHGMYYKDFDDVQRVPFNYKSWRRAFLDGLLLISKVKQGQINTEACFPSMRELQPLITSEGTIDWPKNCCDALPDKLNILVFGVGGCGKTSVIQRLAEGTWSDKYEYHKENTWTVVRQYQDKIVSLEILEPSGESAWNLRDFIMKADAVLVIYSIISGYSRKEIPDMMDQVDRWKDPVPLSEIPIVFAGNKLDLFDQRSNGVSEMLVLAAKYYAGLLEVSAFHNINIHLMIDMLILEYLAKKHPQGLSSVLVKKSKKKNKDKDKNCCIS